MYAENHLFWSEGKPIECHAFITQQIFPAHPSCFLHYSTPLQPLSKYKYQKKSPESPQYFPYQSVHSCLKLFAKQERKKCRTDYCEQLRANGIRFFNLAPNNGAGDPIGLVNFSSHIPPTSWFLFRAARLINVVAASSTALFYGVPSLDWFGFFICFIRVDILVFWSFIISYLCAKL